MHVQFGLNVPNSVLKRASNYVYELIDSSLYEHPLRLIKKKKKKTDIVEKCYKTW